ncbi:putative acetyltransferase [Dysgonomonas sp. PFB1-18]|uniref:GNAT family N-acetyltransferase n=1 Tax=unclassified Dysgonomonas TaxID=2630389 RepID=UPI002473031C|nr:MULTISPECIES: GNAT family N-acetyltransferase [unclassified Dysgonomonas]MDH6309207.1 putative acetyltransferase [Dysgonomonas sp. PF1-14]MDH6338913.1 putative acetyltransferase [Dysgonomonas sp. PF1-16]MDH6380456.1 putative acetyltransferase [Dysgonomonas sp. PFB1-18]MDH6397741.1 putative acetyltransferase [Dysgonomonas sp. PF1-23]
MMKDLTIRPANDSDIEEIAQLFYDTVQNISNDDYSKEQINDWSSSYNNTDKWKERIDSQYFIVAEYKEQIVGFSSLAPDGYLDFMYVHKDCQRLGIARRLLEAIEKKAVLQNNHFIYSDVSITARPFFELCGYRVKKQQSRKSNNSYLTNFRMVKLLQTI